MKIRKTRFFIIVYFSIIIINILKTGHYINILYHTFYIYSSNKGNNFKLHEIAGNRTYNTCLGLII